MHDSPTEPSANHPGTRNGKTTKVPIAGILLAGPLGKAISSVVTWWLNRCSSRGRAPVGAAARRLHERIPVADLHTDSLLWERDLLRRSRRGHVDLPRLIEGGVAFQVFSAVTKVPWGQNIERNEDSSDNVTLLAISQGWPKKTWHSSLARALHQAHRLEHFERRSGGRLRIVRNRRDLAGVLERRTRSSAVVGALLSLEGAHALEGRLDNLEVLYGAGFRMVSPSHFFDTNISGSAHGVHKAGLTALGRQWVERMEKMRMVIDLAHASVQTIDDVLSLATRPVIVSHTGVTGTCDNRRNLPDEQLRGIAATGGLIGIGFWREATCGDDIAAIVRAIRHAVEIAGADHVALGSDFDGAVRTAIDASQLPEITAALMRAGFEENDIAKIMGGNVIRLFGRVLPD